MDSVSTIAWQAALWRRFCHHWLLKGVGITLAIAGFMVVYFALQAHPQFAVVSMPRTPLDAWVAFVWWAWIPYVSLWLYIGCVPALLYLRGEMPRYVLSAVLLAGIGCGIFFFFPTDVPASPIDWSNWPVLAMLKQADAGGNAFPSLHVGFAVQTVIWMAWLLRKIRAPGWLHAVNIVWCVLIVWSTLATRQHVLLDALAGASLGALIALGVLLTRRGQVGTDPAARAHT